MEKTWDGINNVLARTLKNTKPITVIKDPNNNDSVTIDLSRIADVLSDHFASVGPKPANTLQTVQRNYFDYTNGSNSRDSSFAFNLQYSSQIVETGFICLEFSPNFLHLLLTPLFSLKCAPLLPQC